MDRSKESANNRMVAGLDVTPQWWRRLTPAFRRREPLALETAAAGMLGRVFRVATERGLIIERLELNEGNLLLFLYVPIDGSIGRIDEHRDALLSATADLDPLAAV